MKAANFILQRHSATPKSHDYIDPLLHTGQRALSSILMLFYLYTSPYEPILAQQGLWIISLGTLYLSLILFNAWCYQRFSLYQAQLSQLYVYSDVIFAGFCYFLDTGPVSIGLLYLMLTTLSNSCQHGEFFFKLSVSVSLMVLLFTTLLHFSLTHSIPSFSWIIQITFYYLAIMSISLLYLRLQEVTTQQQRQQSLDPITGMLSLDTFLQKAHTGIELRHQNRSQQIMMLIDIGSKASDSVRFIPPNKRNEAIKYMTRLLHIHTKTEDLCCRINETLFVILLFDRATETATELGTALQHDFTLWSDRYNNRLMTAIAITSPPSFSLPINYLLYHTKKGLLEAIKQRGIPDIIICPEITEVDYANSLQTF